MKKRFIFIFVIIFIVCLFVFSINLAPEERGEMQSLYPRIGQKLWTYHMNKHQWRKYNESDDTASKDEIVLQVKGFEGDGGYTAYYLLTGNEQVPKQDVWVGEGSQEFLIDKSLYSFFPKTFEYYEVVFNGVKFVPRKLKIEEVQKLFPDYNIIKVSELQKGTFRTKFSSKAKKFIVINDVGEDFYKYYIVPNDSKKLELGEYSNQFKVNEAVNVKIQRLEGCSKAFPCYEIEIK